MGVVNRAEWGALGERLAAEFLTSAGYVIRARNVRVPPWGEIDIVAERDGVLALVEVRLRRGSRYGEAAASLSPAKQRRMRNAAVGYLTQLGDAALPARIDLVAVSLDGHGLLAGIEHIENAVEG